MGKQEITQIPVQISTLCPAPGYAAGINEKRVYLLSPDQVVRAMGDTEVLYDIAINEGIRVHPGDHDE